MAIVRINAHFCNKIEKMYLAYVATYLNHTRLLAKNPVLFPRISNRESKAKGSQLLCTRAFIKFVYPRVQ